MKNIQTNYNNIDLSLNRSQLLVTETSQIRLVIDFIINGIGFR